jgi:hypothetical protein
VPVTLSDHPMGPNGCRFSRGQSTALLRSLESLLQLPKVSVKALDVPLIPGASQAFTLQLRTQALAFALLAQTFLIKPPPHGPTDVGHSTSALRA